LQQVRDPNQVLNEALRVGRQVIVGFPNFAYLTARLQMFFMGRAPVTPSLPYQWYDTPNSHFLSIRDFKDYCRQQQIRVEQAVYFGNRTRVRLLPNIFAQSGIFMIKRKES
jgi:methionine biosynthesis protein MetW